MTTDENENEKQANDCAGCGERAGVHPPEWRITDSMEILPDPSAPTRAGDIKFCNGCYQEYKASMNDRRDSGFVTGVGIIPQEY